MLKKIIISLGIIIGIGVTVLSQEAELYTPINIQKAFEKGTRSKDGMPGPNYWQNRANYSMKIKLDAESSTLYGNETIHYINNSPDTLYRIIFQLFSDIYKAGNPRDFNIDPADEHDGVLITHFSIDGNKMGISPNNREMISLNTGMVIFPEKPVVPGSETTF